MFTANDLRTLAGTGSKPAVSMFLPTHVAGRECRQDPIRMGNLINDAIQRLMQLGFRRPDARALLGPAMRLLPDGEFWRHQDRGLAVFVAPGFFRRFQVPLEFKEEMIVGPRFQVKPLLPLLMEQGRYLILTLSASRARIVEATPYEITERGDIKLPAGVAEITAETDYENSLRMNPVAHTRAGMPKMQNLGDGPEEQRKTQLIEYLHRTEAALESQLHGDRAPIVLAAHPEINGHFRSITKLPSLVPQSLEINPDGLDPEDLHQRAQALVRPLFENGHRMAMERLRQFLGEHDSRATLDAYEIITDARYGRVDTLFLADSAPIWGRFDESAGKAIVHESTETEDFDLVDDAAVRTLRHGGQVEFLPRGALPGDAMMAALLRY
jgi:hypothetical protein